MFVTFWGMFVTAGLSPAHDWRPFQAQLFLVYKDPLGIHPRLLKCTRTLFPLSRAIVSGESFSGLSPEKSVEASCQTLSITGISVTCWLRPTPTRQERATFLAPHRPQQSTFQGNLLWSWKISSFSLTSLHNLLNSLFCRYALMKLKSLWETFI